MGLLPSFALKTLDCHMMTGLTPFLYNGNFHKTSKMMQASNIVAINLIARLEQVELTTPFLCFTQHLYLPN
jgi:hypothetical protein